MEILIGFLLGGAVAAVVGWFATRNRPTPAMPVTIANWGAGIVGALFLLYNLSSRPFGLAIVTTLGTLVTLWLGAFVVAFAWPFLRNALLGGGGFAAGKPVVSVEQYAPLLSAALMAMTDTSTVDGLAASVDPSDPQANAEYVRALSAHWEHVNAKRLELEQVQPDPRLSAVHTEAVKLLRAWITMMNASNASVVAAFQGDFARRQKLQRDADSWNETMRSVGAKLEQALASVRDQQPTLYDLLQLNGTPFDVARI